MIAYNKTWLANLRVKKTVQKNLSQGFITDAEFVAISQKYPIGFYSPPVLARIGLAVLTFIIIVFADCLLSFMMVSTRIIDSFGWLFFLGAFSYFILEVIVNTKLHYRSGVDDALLFISGCLFTGGFFMMLSGIESGTHYLPLCALIFLLTFFFSLRFTDMLMSTVCCLSFFAFIFFGWEKIEAIGLSTVPFIIMAVSAFIYWLSYTYQKKFQDYEDCFGIAQIVSLLTLYAAGNYFIVQSLSNEINGSVKPISFGAFFWVWTMLLPFVYLWFGLKRKDSLLLRTGLLLIAAAVATFRTYYHVLPTDVALTIVGVLLLGVVYLIMKYLKIPKHGFTYADLNEANIMDKLKIESLIVAQTFSHTPSAPADKGVKFGGGDFGGGGSSGGF